MTKQSDANLLLMDIMDSINKYFNKPLNGQIKSKEGRVTTVKPKRKIKPAENPILHKDKFAKCKYCGGEEFFWGETEWGWRLFDKDNTQHMCKDTVKSEQLTTG